MTTVKEFEQQKQDIINTILDGWGKATILDKVKILQPPRSTCSTCRHLHPDYNYSDSWDFCSKKGILTEYSTVQNEDASTFGCIHHSDYEVNNE
jgi:hypothetical protein